MRVQLLTHSYIPENTPPSRRWEIFVAELRAAGFHVDVIAPEPDPRRTGSGEVGGSELPNYGPVGERIRRVPGGSILNGSRDGRFIASVVQSLCAVPVGLSAPRPDVLVVTVPALPMVVPAWIVSKLRQTPLIVEMRDAWPDLAYDSGVKSGLLSKMLAAVVNGAQRSAVLVVTVTDGFAQRLQSRGISQVLHIGNGVRDVRSIAVSEARERQSGELNVLYLGNHGESQGLDLLIRAASIAREQEPGIVVRFVGGGTQKQEFEELNRWQGSPVELLPPVESGEVETFYRWADTCVVSLRSDWPSFEWTVPSKTYELISAGAHITGVVTGETAKILRDYGNAIIVPADAEQIAEAWVLLARDRKSTPRSPAGPEWVSQNAVLPVLGRRMVDSVASVYRQSVSERGGEAITSELENSSSQQWRINASLTATTIADHLTDDPVLLALQVSRRLPQKLRNPLALLGQHIHGGPLDAVRGVSMAAAGRSGELQRLAVEAVENRSPQAQLVTWAEILINDGDAKTGRWILDRVRPGTRGRNAAMARFLWHQGNMTRAIERLDGKQHRKQQERMASELRSYQGKAPQLNRVSDYKAFPDTALHVLTNSLPQTGSGYAQRSHSILLSLQERGWDVSAVTRIGWPVQTGSMTARGSDVVDGIKYWRLLPRKLARGFDARLQQQAEMLLELVRRKRPAILHTTTHWTNAMVVRAVAQAVDVPWVYEVRGQLADTWASTRDDDAANSERYRLFSEREDDAARSASAVVTLGENMRKRLIDAGVDSQRIGVCPNAVGGVFLEEPASKSAARRDLGLETNLEYVGTISSIVPYEGLDTVLRAVAMIAPDRPQLRVLYVGDGTDLPRLKDLAATLGITGRFIAPGRVDRNKAHLYHQALDVFVVPRIDSPVTRSVTPMKPVEALASARPVVASDLPALEELVDNGETGLLVEPENPPGWAKALEMVLDEQSLGEFLGSKGRRWVLENRTWAANAEKYDRIYRHLLD